MTTTRLLVTTIVIILGIYDLIVVVRGAITGKGIDYSISRFMQWLPRRATFFVCVVFYVMGHFWGFMDCPICPESAPVLSPFPQKEPLPEAVDDAL